MGEKHGKWASDCQRKCVKVVPEPCRRYHHELRKLYRKVLRRALYEWTMESLPKSEVCSPSDLTVSDWCRGITA